jgi:hypothetical protein
MIDEMLIEKRYGNGLWSNAYLDLMDLMGECGYLQGPFQHWQRENGREAWPQ